MGTEHSTDADEAVDRIIQYHIRTKHHLNRYSRSLGYLDWANQPDPFRRFEGAQLISLPLLEPDAEPRSPLYEAIYHYGLPPSQSLNVRTLSRFFEFALALSAWKRAGESEWALRSNPSSGNLHPTEGYVILPHGLDLRAGLYHYAPKEHGLELRADFPSDALARLMAPFPQYSFLFGLTSVHWREAWKYGERAFRYCNHDVGHAIGSARIAAATLGWGMVLLDGASHDTIAALLGIDRREDFAHSEPEHPDCLAVIWPQDTQIPHEINMPLFLTPVAVAHITTGTWYGKANRLSREHAVHWDLIDEASEASRKSTTEHLRVSYVMELSSDELEVAPEPALSAGQIIRQRRSAVAFDGKTFLSSDSFFQMLSRVMPQQMKPQTPKPVPWDVWPYEPAIHLLLFVHRIQDVTPGLYFLVRDPAKLPLLQQSMNEGLNWVRAPGSPDNLPLYWLLEGDAKKLAAQVSCHQDIAGDSAFSFGMLAEFEGLLRERGAWWYPRLFWESGLLGQVLYLEAEAAGVRATGIGCFFDDPVHEIVAIKGLSFQSLYHFTVGGAVEDRRLLTLPPYFHKQAGR